MLARLMRFLLAYNAKFAIHAIVLLCLVWSSGHAVTSTIDAVPLTGIKIDGDLSDWPEDMEKHLVGLSASEYYERTDIYRAELSANADLSPYFRIGYNADNNLLYIGLEVRDDDLVTGNAYNASDACEIYVGRVGEQPQQYVLVPGSQYHGWGERESVRTRKAYSRQGDVTVYEWAIEVIDRGTFNLGSGEPLHLAAGETLAFDVVVVDKDRDDYQAAWIPWGSLTGTKTAGSDRVGRVFLTEGAVLPAAPQDNGSSALMTAIGIGIVILCLGFAGYLVRRAAPAANGGQFNGLAERLENIERRMTDTQEVMIALSEKYDLLDDRVKEMRENEQEI